MVIGCENGTTNNGNPLLGFWVMSFNTDGNSYDNTQSREITENRITQYRSDSAECIVISVTRWELETNSNVSSASQFPSGYRVTGTVLINTMSTPYNIGGVTIPVDQTGASVSLLMYLNNTKNRFVTRGVFPTGVYVKQ